MELPTRTDISPSDCLSLDERSAVENFYGKSLGDAEAMFRECAINYGEDLCYMGLNGFSFYFQAYENYARSPDAVGDYSVVTQFLTIQYFRLDLFADAKLADEEWNCVSACVDYFLENLDDFDLDDELEETRGKLVNYRLRFTGR